MAGDRSRRLTAIDRATKAEYGSRQVPSRPLESLDGAADISAYRRGYVQLLNGWRTHLVRLFGQREEQARFHHGDVSAELGGRLSISSPATGWPRIAITCGGAAHTAQIDWAAKPARCAATSIVRRKLRDRNRKEGIASPAALASIAVGSSFDVPLEYGQHLLFCGPTLG